MSDLSMSELIAGYSPQSVFSCFPHGCNPTAQGTVDTWYVANIPAGCGRTYRFPLGGGALLGWGPRACLWVDQMTHRRKVPVLVLGRAGREAFRHDELQKEELSL